MGMINCPECGKEISDKAASCPNCGCPIEAVSTGTSNTYNATGNSTYQSNNPYQTQQSSPQVRPYMPKQKNSGLGIAALVLSILGCTFIVGAILAIVDLCKKDGNKKTCSIIALCICGFWLIIGIIGVSGGDSSEQTSSNRTTVETNQTQTTDEEDVSVETLDTETIDGKDSEVEKETKEDNEPAPESEENGEEINNIFYVGDVLETKKIRLSYLSCGEYIDDNMFVEAGAGNKFVYFEYEFENIGDTDVSVGSFDFDCYADGYDAKSSMCTADNAMISITTLSPGRKTNGIVVFEVPQNAEVIEVEYETSYWTQDKAIFIYE